MGAPVRKGMSGVSGMRRRHGHQVNLSAHRHSRVGFRMPGPLQRLLSNAGVRPVFQFTLYLLDWG